MALTGQTDGEKKLLPDVGTLSYNGVVFTSLFKTSVDGKAVKDNAERTVKWVEWTISVEGFVTLDGTNTTIDQQMVQIKNLLNQQGGTLTYSGKGLGNVVVNTPAAGKLAQFTGLRDLAWGPKPEVLNFQPLGGSRSARVKWTVTTCLPVLVGTTLTTKKSSDTPPNIVQFNEETSISYDEDCYSTITIKGTLEIAMTRNAVKSNSVPDHVDLYRKKFMEKVADNNFDLNYVRVTKRTFTYSRDKRVMEWEFQAEELPPMGLPPWATTARGRMTVRPFKQGVAIVRWVCSLTATYTIRNDVSRRAAWAAFVSLWNFRMSQSAFGFYPDATKDGEDEQNPGRPQKPLPKKGFFTKLPDNIERGLEKYWRQKFKEAGKNLPEERLTFPVHFAFDEGLYLDSKTITFEASWWLLTSFSHLQLATGVWKVPDNTVGEDEWPRSTRDIMGWTGVMTNLQTPFEDVIVDFGGGA